MTEDSYLYLIFALDLILRKSLGQKYSLEQILPCHDISIYINGAFECQKCALPLNNVRRNRKCHFLHIRTLQYYLVSPTGLVLSNKTGQEWKGKHSAIETSLSDVDPTCASDLCGRTASCANLKWVWIGSSLNSCDQSGSVAWQEQDGIGENLFGNFEFIRPPSCFTPSFFHDWFLLRIVRRYVPELFGTFWEFL